MFALHRGDIVRIRDERWAVVRTDSYGDTSVVAAVGCDRGNRGVRASYLLPFERIDRLTAGATTRVVSHRRWQYLARDVVARSMPASDSLRTASTANVDILPYQLEPALALLSGTASRILIADDVGLGKTIQAGLAIAETLARRGDGHVLVMCPAGLRDQWQSELSNRFRLSPVVLDATALRREPIVDGANPWTVHSLILTSTDYIKRPEVARALEPMIWDLLVIDEAHGIARVSGRHDAAALLAQRARSVIMLSATPHSGDEGTFERLTSVGDVDGAFPLLAFRRTRADVDDRTPRRTCWLRVRPTDAERQLHHALMTYVRRVWRQPASSGARLAMIIVTRRACSCAASLVRTLERRLALLGDTAQVENQLLLPWEAGVIDDEPDVNIAAPGLPDADSERREIERILTLGRRAQASESKFRALTRLLRRCNEPALVFTEYRDTLTSLELALGAFGTSQLHGSLSASERADVIRAFTSGRSRLLLATDAASEGLNLQQACRLVVHLEVPWTPTRVEQRVGRVDRIGQPRRVHQVHLVAAGTVEASRAARLIQRASHIASELGVLTASPIDEYRAAACIVGNEPFPAGPAPATVSNGVVKGDLRQRAHAEAVRLEAARRLWRIHDRVVPAAIEPRPFVTRARHDSPGAAWWAFHVEYVDCDGQILWETLIGAHGVHSWDRPVQRADLRRLTEASWDPVRRRVEDAPIDGGITGPTAAAMEREQAIVRVLAGRHARIAASLIQGSLFDRRNERLVAAQRELLDEALARCNKRLGQLERRQLDLSTVVRPAFALFAW